MALVAIPPPELMLVPAVPKAAPQIALDVPLGGAVVAFVAPEKPATETRILNCCSPPETFELERCTPICRPVGEPAPSSCSMTNHANRLEKLFADEAFFILLTPAASVAPN